MVCSDRISCIPVSPEAPILPAPFTLFIRMGSMFFTEENWLLLGGLNCSLLIIFLGSQAQRVCSTPALPIIAGRSLQGDRFGFNFLELRSVTVVISPRGAGGDFYIFLVSISFPLEGFFLDLDFLLELFVFLMLNLRLSGKSYSLGHSGMGLWVGMWEGRRESSQSILTLLDFNLWLRWTLRLGGSYAELSVLLRLEREVAISMESMEGTSMKQVSCPPRKVATTDSCFNSSFNFLLSFFSQFHLASACGSTAPCKEDESSRLMLISFSIMQFLYFWVSWSRCEEKATWENGEWLQVCRQIPTNYCRNLL